MQTLAQRMLPNQRLKLTDQLSVAPELKVSLYALLGRRQPLLL
jgi:hypothetical protein